MDDGHGLFDRGLALLQKAVVALLFVGSLGSYILVLSTVYSNPVLHHVNTQQDTTAPPALQLTRPLESTFSDNDTGTMRIGFYNGPGTGGAPVHQNRTGLDWFYQTLEESATSAFGGHGFRITNLSGLAVQHLSRSDFDVVVFPGGSGNGQAKGIKSAGMLAVRKFVAEGGGYIGTCGGAFLAIVHLKLYGDPSPHVQQPWDRGHGPVLVEFSPLGLKALGLGYKGNVTIKYWQGPIVKVTDLPADVQVLATFRTEIHSDHPEKTTGEMIDTPAMTALDGPGGAGRVVLNSPHPELPLSDAGSNGTHYPAMYAGELRYIRDKQANKADY